MTNASGPPLRIAMVAPLWTSVPPAQYGGAELIVNLLTEELVSRGHEVTLFASGDSSSSAKVHAVCPTNLLSAMEQGHAYEYEHYANSAVAEAVREEESFDLIHCHLGFPQVPIANLARIPVLYTLNTVPSIDDYWVLARHQKIELAAISAHQAAALPPSCRANTRVIHHGIDFDAYEASYEPGGYLVFVARMSPQKSPLDAIRIAKAAGMRIVLAGAPQNASERIYFDEQVRPQIDGQNVRYVGLVDHAQKNDLLKRASALLFPIQGEEAFGLIMVEAMACGTPVLAWQRASTFEIVVSGETGFCSDSTESLAALVPSALRLDRKTVRARAQARFSYQRMTDDYIDAYRALVSAGRASTLSSESISAEAPRSVSGSVL